MRFKLIILFLVLLDIPLLLYLLLTRSELRILNPAGPIAMEQKSLIETVVVLGLLLIIPTVIITYITVFRFRSTNKNAIYKPDWHTTPLMQVGLWAIPTALILILVVITWQSTHKLDPTKQLQGQEQPMAIQVVALRWKWLFIYPKEHIATVNYVAFPEKTPVTFYLTAEAPMSSFWIPNLAGQMYAMEGMVNRLNLMADKPGSYPGSNAEISGAGFASMHFTAQAMTKEEYAHWIAQAKTKNRPLSQSTYEALVEPSENVSPMVYSSVHQGLYNEIVMKYMAPTGTETQMHHDMNAMPDMEGMSH